MPLLSLLAAAWLLAGSALAECPAPRSVNLTEQDLHQLLQQLLLKSGFKSQVELRWAPELKMGRDVGSPATALAANSKPNDKPYPVILVTPDLLDMASTREEVGFTLAHEVVHVLHGDADRAIFKIGDLYTDWRNDSLKRDPDYQLPKDWKDLGDQEFTNFFKDAKPALNSFKREAERQADAEGLALFNVTFPNADKETPACAMDHINDLLAVLGLAKLAAGDDTHDPVPARAKKLREFIAQFK